MIIKEITVKNYGPFSNPTSIVFDPEVTVLTGANDTGKSSVLKLIDLIWNRKVISEDEANIDRILTSAVPWKDDVEIGCTVKYHPTSLTRRFLNGIKSDYCDCATLFL